MSHSSPVARVPHARALIPVWPQPPRRRRDLPSSTSRRTLLMLEEVMKRVEEFDVVHFQYLAVPPPACAASARLVYVTTLMMIALRHARAPTTLRQFDDVPVVSIYMRSAQPSRLVARRISRVAVNLLPFHPGPGNTLAFLGRIAREKRLDRAIAQRPCRATSSTCAFGGASPADRDYFSRTRFLLLLDNAALPHSARLTNKRKPSFWGEGHRLGCFRLTGPSVCSL